MQDRSRSATSRQQPVPGEMPLRIVEQLELVEVDEEGARLTGPGGPILDLCAPSARRGTPRPVGQAGERIEIGEIEDALLSAFPFPSHRSGTHATASNRQPHAPERRGRIAIAPACRGHANAILALPGVERLLRMVEAGGDAFPIVRMNPLDEARGVFLQFLLCKPEQLDNAGAGIRQRPSAVRAPPVLVYATRNRRPDLVKGLPSGDRAGAPSP